MITSNDFRPGVTIEIENQVWQVVEFQHGDTRRRRRRAGQRLFAPPVRQLLPETSDPAAHGGTGVQL